jgi:ectoine hydroxylase-related dioxygenase (phytanoyl-CoA dioxygenase family)
MVTVSPTSSDSQALDEHFRELDELGYTVLVDLLSPAQVERAIAALNEIYEREKDVLSHEPGTKRTFNLTARAEIFREIIQLPQLVACMAYLLGPDYILSDMGGRSPLPGVAPQNLHRDGGRFLPDPPENARDVLPIAAQSMFAFSEFTTENGATRFVPRSHNTNIDPATVAPENEFLFTCAPGSVLVYDNRLVHGGGPNRTNVIRYSAQGFCCRKFVRPFCDHTRSIPAELVAAASPLLRRLWGFEYQSAWEESPRQFKIMEAPGAKPVFDFNRRHASAAR